MKSHLDTALTIYEGILADAAVRWPELIVSFEKDLSYLRRVADQRGLSFFTIILPSAGKVLDRSLSRGCLLRQEYPQGYPNSSKRAKCLFGDLLSKVFSNDDIVLPDADSDAIFFLRQLYYCCKKYRLQCDPDVVKATVDSFFEVEASLPPPRPNTFGSWDPRWPRVVGHPLGDYPANWSETDYDPRWTILRFVSDVVIADIGVPDWRDLTGRHGPGVVAEGSSISNKYEFGNWPSRLQGMFPYEYYASGLLDCEHKYTEWEQMSRLIAVPKTQKGPRLICAEPLAHQWIQQSIWRWLRERIPSTILSRSVTFDSQENSRSRALRASIDGSLATIDLSEASDRLSCRLVQYVFGRSPLLDYMWACRTNYVSQTISSTSRKGCSLRKFAPMGSALTFPIQSIVFSIISIAALLLSEETESLSIATVRSAAERITVFGDDIIVPTPCYGHLVRLLSDCGLKVNTDKSFSEGFFRESCGMDAYKGVDVTPSYLLQTYDGTAQATATIVEMSNNFFKRGLWKTSLAIVGLLPEGERKLLLVTGDDLGGLGLFSYCGSSTAHLKKVYDRDLQREFSVALLVDSRSTRVRGRGTADLTQYFIEDPSAQHYLERDAWEAGQVSKTSIRKRKSRVPR